MTQLPFVEQTILELTVSELKKLDFTIDLYCTCGQTSSRDRFAVLPQMSSVLRVYVVVELMYICSTVSCPYCTLAAFHSLEL